jgi:hypothetical protein
MTKRKMVDAHAKGQVKDLLSRLETVTKQLIEARALYDDAAHKLDATNKVLEIRTIGFQMQLRFQREQIHKLLGYDPPPPSRPGWVAEWVSATKPTLAT